MIERPHPGFAAAKKACGRIKEIIEKTIFMSVVIAREKWKVSKSVFTNIDVPHLLAPFLY